MGTTFDRVRVAMRLVRLSMDGTEEADFFFSSMIILVLIFDFNGADFNVDADEHVEEEFDLNSLCIIEELPNNFIYLFKLVFTDDIGVNFISSFFYERKQTNHRRAKGGTIPLTVPRVLETLIFVLKQ